MTTLTYVDFVDKVYQALVANTVLAGDSDLMIEKRLSKDKDPLVSQNPTLGRHKLLVVEIMAGTTTSALQGSFQIQEDTIRVAIYCWKLSATVADTREQMQTLRSEVIKAIADATWVGMPRPQFAGQPEPQPTENYTRGDVLFRVKQGVSVL